MSSTTNQSTFGRGSAARAEKVTRRQLRKNRRIGELEIIRNPMVCKRFQSQPCAYA
jgi:hypothetical protein